MEVVHIVLDVSVILKAAGLRDPYLFQTGDDHVVMLIVVFQIKDFCTFQKLSRNMAVHLNND